MDFNYQKICQMFLGGLSERTQKVISRRFGLEGNERKTLESIGKEYGITRERVRQIEKDGLLRIKPEAEKQEKVFQYLASQIKSLGELKKEDKLLSFLGGNDFQNHIYFLLSLDKRFARLPENESFHSLWTVNFKSVDLAKKVIDSLYKMLNKNGRPLSFESLKKERKDLPERTLFSFLEISKKIQPGLEGLYGLKTWPEVNPRGVKDKAYLVFQKEKRPLHFTEVAKLIDSLNLPLAQNGTKTRALPQTVHNELIRDQRFVLVGRGLYALKDWGYMPGTVSDVILQVLQGSKKPLTREEIMEKVLKQRVVKENTILLNLVDKKYFFRNPQGKYQIRKA